MDYKVLVEQLRGILPPKVDYAEMVMVESVHYGKCFVYEDPESYVIDAAATALETLLAERNAAVEMLHGECHACKHNTGWHNRGKCRSCVHETAKYPYKEEREADNWQWRGPADRKTDIESDAGSFQAE